MRPEDITSKFNIDYRKSDLSESDQCGGYPYNRPTGWYCHALNVNRKYSDGDAWHGTVNGKDEWPVAFHGTHPYKISSVSQKDLFRSAVETDTARQEAVEQMGSTMDQPGIYLTTHCTGGAHPHYTSPFSLEMPNGKSKTFRVVFMCRVQPGKFTTHEGSVSKGQTWRLVDPDAIRTYSILIKDEDASDKC